MSEAKIVKSLFATTEKAFRQKINGVDIISETDPDDPQVSLISKFRWGSEQLPFFLVERMGEKNGVKWGKVEIRPYKQSNIVYADSFVEGETEYSRLTEYILQALSGFLPIED